MMTIQRRNDSEDRASDELKALLEEAALTFEASARAHEAMTTLSGRVIALPRTRGRIGQRLAQVDAWLLQESVAEAIARDDDYNLTRFRGITPSAPTTRRRSRKRSSVRWLTAAERDDLNVYLFGDAAGRTVGLPKAECPVWEAA